MNSFLYLVYMLLLIYTILVLISSIKCFFNEYGFAVIDTMFTNLIFTLHSGEKTTTKEWPILLEIKGRVRLDAFEKFVRELPNSRSRAVMVFVYTFTSIINVHVLYTHSVFEPLQKLLTVTFNQA
jgi:hypothetical protein